MKRHILILFAFYAGLWLQAANEENIVYTNASNLQLIGKATVEGDFFIALTQLIIKIYHRL